MTNPDVSHNERANRETWFGLLLAVVLSLTLFTGGVAFAYWADEMQHPSLNEQSYPPPVEF